MADPAAFLVYTFLPIAFQIRRGTATGIGFSFDGWLELLTFGWLLTSFALAHIWLARASWMALRHRGLVSADAARTAVLAIALLACYAPAFVLTFE